MRFFILVLWIAVSAMARAATGDFITVTIPSFELADQHGQKCKVRFPRDRVSIITVADRQGSQQIESWIRPIRQHYNGLVTIEGVADVSSAPNAIRPLLASLFRRTVPFSVMLDWTGKVSASFQYRKRVANVYLVDRQGKVLLHLAGLASESSLKRVFDTYERAERATLRLQGDPFPH